MAFAEVQVILMDRDIFRTLQMKGHVLHLAAAHLITYMERTSDQSQELPMFLLRLNEINGGCEKDIFMPFYSSGAVEWNGKVDAKTICRS